MTRNDPELAGNVCLALVAEGPTHGWAVAGQLAPGSAIGRIWSLSRPLTYRALDGLLASGAVERVGTEPGGGRTRTLLGVTAAGRRRNDEWLGSTVALPRDVRSELLLKFALRERAAMSNVELARAQRERFAPMLATVETDAASDGDFVDRWRLEHIRAIDRFLASFVAAPVPDHVA